MDNNDARADRVGDEVRVAHTPGPWIVHPLIARVDCGFIGSDGYPLPICQMLWPTEERTEERTWANARLIAAAPDEHSALHNAVEFLWFYFLSPEAGINREVESDRNMIAEARMAYEIGKAAIAKAEGRLS